MVRRSSACIRGVFSESICSQEKPVQEQPTRMRNGINSLAGGPQVGPRLRAGRNVSQLYRIAGSLQGQKDPWNSFYQRSIGLETLAVGERATA